jgi:hypothetical protein
MESSDMSEHSKSRSLFGVADVGGFAFPDGVLGGEEVDAFVVVDGAVFCDVVGADGVVGEEDYGIAFQWFETELSSAWGEWCEDDGAGGIFLLYWLSD